jgi:hypothetical protein
MVAWRIICVSFIALSLLIVGLWASVFRHSGLVYPYSGPDGVMYAVFFCSFLWFCLIFPLAVPLLNRDWQRDHDGMPYPAWLVASAVAGWPACWIGWVGFVYHIAPAC